MRVFGRHHPGAVFLAAAALLATGGCRSLTLVVPGSPTVDDLEAAAAARTPTAAPRTIPVEIIVVRHDTDDAVLRDELWGVVDEQVFAADVRRQLAANGLRCGVVTGDLPSHLTQRIATVQQEPTGDMALPGGTRRTLRLLPGRRADIVAAPAVTELVLLEETRDGTCGRTFADAGGFFTLRAWPAADGRIRIEAVPEIRHGPLRRSWVGEEGMFRLEATQARHSLDQLRMIVTLPPQGRLVIACGGDPAATVGDALLRDGGTNGTGSQRLFILRPLSGGADPAFGEDEANEED
jgi:hypothetical protein